MQIIEVAEFIDQVGVVWSIRLENPRLSDVLLWVTTTGEVGVNGVLVKTNPKLYTGDRVEIYPALQVDPKEKRRRLVERKRSQ